MPVPFKQRALEFYAKHGTRLEIAFFVGGFLVDAIFLSDVDDLLAFIQQVVFLIVIAALIHFEIVYRAEKWKPEGRFVTIWNYRILIMHFCLGTLLNMYSLFYIKSSSFLSSVVFVVGMSALILANELPIVKKAHVSLKFGLYAICLFSFYSILLPMILGFVGFLPFTLSIVMTVGTFFIQFKLLSKSLPDFSILMRAILAPGFSVITLFILFFFLGWIPPVPISVAEQGIYHHIEKSHDGYTLSIEKYPSWKFWLSSDEDFKAEPGDVIYFYAQVYSPARFSDEIFIQWSLKETNGKWYIADRVPMKILGGRKNGFRGYANKSNYKAGEWRIQLLTSNGQEISRLYFDVSIVDTNPARTFDKILK